ncbi:MAG TPA: DUF2339 domain-containing protein [Verrucomicrobiae bacterium]|nr:DUF2339 domain-containing protein [Verrucomicrobiae bacterium]
MNESDKQELARLREQQARLEQELKQLSRQLATFEQKLAASPAPVLPIQSPLPSVSQSASTMSGIPPALPPIIQKASVPFEEAKPFPGTRPVQKPLAQAETAIASAAIQPKTATEPPSSTIPLPPSMAQVPASAPREGSFEMRLGTYWLVRVGVVMVLTGLVFFGNLAYQNYISKLGPAGKVSLLYVASGCLLAAGWWWQRKAVKETLRNYAQVLFAGGLGAIYFTTYAAHHLEPLRVIQSASFDGVLLIGCAGLMVWAAERKKSEVLAFFAVGLAYYSSIITRGGYFTLWSNLVLSTASVFFLVRNRWAALSFCSIAATYAAYAFWRFFTGITWEWAAPGANLWFGTGFLICYWLVFTAAVFLSRNATFTGANRASFISANNGAFFTLFLLTMAQVHQGGFWKFCLVYGGALLALAALARQSFREERLIENAYLTQGLLLATVGLIFKFSGMHLALVLATESVLLLIISQQRKNLVLLTGAHVAAALAVGWGMDGLRDFDRQNLSLGIGIGVLMLINAWLAHRKLEKAGPSEKLLRGQPTYFCSLAILIWVLSTWHNTHREIFPVVIALEAVLLTASTYALGIGELAVLSQGVMAFALGSWAVVRMDSAMQLPWWNPAAMIALSLALSHWWPRQTRIRKQNEVFWPALYGFGINAVLYLWLAPRESASSWIVTGSLVAIGVTAYGVATRAWFLAAVGQLFLAMAVGQFGWQLWQSTPPWRHTLVPIGALVLLSVATVQWFKFRPASDPKVREPLLETALVYRWIALAMSITWVWEYVPPRERIWVLSLLGLAFFVWSGLKHNREALLISAVYTVSALTLFWLPLVQTPSVYLPNLVAIVALLGQRQAARRFPDRYPVDPAIHNAVILVGSLSVWLFVSRWVLELASGFYLTAAWSLLALAMFTAGMLLRERMYRWTGLGILACALGRVVIFDVWKLEKVYTILSFMALGIVLLVLGFVYSKYQEKIKEWL